MKEIILDDCLTYIQICLSKGIEIVSWRLVLNNGVVWIENKKMELRIKTNELNKTVNDFLQARVNVIEKNNFPEAPALERQNMTLPISSNQTPQQNTTYYSGVDNARRAGLLGCDRAGSW